MLPGSTWRSPTRPANGAVTRVKVSCRRAFSTAALSLRTAGLAGDGILRQEAHVAVKVHARAGELRLILRELPLGLVERRLEGARVDLCEQVPGPYELTLAEWHMQQQSVDPAVDGRGVERAHGPECIDGHIDTAGGGGHRPHWDRPAGIGAPAARPARGLTAGLHGP